MAAVSTSRQTRFAECGLHPWVYQAKDDPTAWRVATDHCRDRFCVPCAREAAARVQRHLLSFLQGKRPRFLTLTLRHDERPLGEQLTDLWRSFKRLRNSPVWRKHVFGGAAFFEVTRARDGAHWHPHLHALVEGKYMPKKLLEEAWLKASRGSWIVDIRDASNQPLTARYVAAYATKGYAGSLLRDEANLPELITALEGRRLAITFGSWRGFSLRDPEGDETWIAVLPLWELREKADRGDEWAGALLSHLAHPSDCPPPVHPPPDRRSASAPVEGSGKNDPTVTPTLWEMTRDRSLDWCLRG